MEPKAAMRKFDRDMYDYPFGEQERHRTGESTFSDDVLYNIIFKDIGDVRIFTLKLYTREWETVVAKSGYCSHKIVCKVQQQNANHAITSLNFREGPLAN